MKSYYSIIRFVNNPLSKENLAIGVIALSDSNIFYKFSKEKINLIHKMSSSSATLLKDTIGKMSKFIDAQLKKDLPLPSRNGQVSLDHLNQLAVYNNDVLKIDDPLVINAELDSAGCNDFFEKYVQFNVKKRKDSGVGGAFQKTIDNVFCKPLQHMIDTNYRLKKQQIPGLFFDYALDGIGVSNKIYMVKCLDLNSDKPLDMFCKKIAELESLNYKLDVLSKEHNLSIDKKTRYLVIDAYKGKKSSYHKFYRTLTKEPHRYYPHTIISSDALPSVTELIKKSQPISKLSEYLKKR